MNADGSGARHFAAHWEPKNYGYMQWSPDGQKLAYYSGIEYPAVGVLDLPTGTARVVSSVPNSSNLAFIWGSGSKSLVVLKSVRLPAKPTSVLYEAGLDGTERTLLDVHTQFPDAAANDWLHVAPRVFLSDRLFVGAGAAEQFVVPMNGDAPRKLPGGSSPRFPRAYVSPGPAREAKWILWLVQNPNRPITSVEIMTAGGDSLRTLNLPFELDPQVFQESFRHPDGRHIILVGKVPGESVSKIYLVPLDGGTPRVLATFTGRLIGRFDLSPDGKTLAYAVEGAPTSTIYELDVSPILQARGKP